MENNHKKPNNWEELKIIERIINNWKKLKTTNKMYNCKIWKQSKKIKNYCKKLETIENN